MPAGRGPRQGMNELVLVGAGPSEALTGQREVDASAMVEYFEPLLVWLEDQNEGRPVGYSREGDRS